MADVEQIKSQDLQMNEMLGEGSFATVYRARYRNQIDVAVKVIKMQSDDPEMKETDEALRERYDQNQSIRFYVILLLIPMYDCMIV